MKKNLQDFNLCHCFLKSRQHLRHVRNYLLVGIFVFQLVGFKTLAQERTVSGQVTASEDGNPMPGVNVVVQGTQNGTVTDSNGNYSLSISSGNVTLVFSFIGYETQQVAVGERSSVDVSLISDATQLSEIVVTSFGIEQEKQSLGFSTQSVKGEDIIQTKQPNLVSALQGQVSGVQITNTGGGPGMSSRIVIRGITSLDPNSNNQPLFVIDGIPIDNSTIESGNTPRGLSNRAADINPNDVESVNILKGAAATALYGVRAANGAVVITTKKGRTGAVRISLGSTIGFDEVNKYPNYQKEYGQGFSGLYNPNNIFPAWGAPFNAATVVDPSYKFYDNNKNVMQTGRFYDNYLNISGGSETATFYASVANTDHEGVIPFSNWGRTSVKFSGTLKFSEKFNISGTATYSNSGGNRAANDRFGETLMYYPTSRDATDYINPDGTQKYFGLSDNPIYSARFWTYEDDVDRTVGNLLFSYKPAPWISFNYRVGSDFYSDFREEILPGPKGIEGEVPLSATGFLEHTRITSRIINSNFFTQVSKDITEKFNASLRLGHELFQEDRNTLVNTGNEFVIPEFYHFSNVKEVLTAENIYQRRLIGVYGDLALNYSDFLYLNITGRNDWTSTLPKGNNSFFYPSVSASFILSNVVELPDQINYAKIRTSYGEVGKDTEPYRTATTYTLATGFPLNDQVGFTRGQVLGSLDLKPERTSTIEFGIETKLLDNKIGLELTWYKSNSKDQILSVPVSNATGYTRFVTNAGEIENKGIELLLTGSPVRTGNLSWDVTLNFTRNRNEVVDIREGLEDITIGSQFGYVGSTVTMKLREGDPYGNLYGTSYQRYYGSETPSDPQSLEHDRAIVIGANGFPVRNGSQLILGNAQPKWLGGLRNTFTYKGISLSFLIDVRWGIDQYDQYNNFISAFGKMDYSLNRNDVVVFDGVLADGTPNSKEVWLGQGVGPDGIDYGAGFYRSYYRNVSENFVKDASFVKLRNVSLSYSIPASVLQRTPFQSASISGTLNNVILWTPWIGYDPESNSAGASGNATAFTGLGYPGVSSLLFSLNLTL